MCAIGWYFVWSLLAFCSYYGIIKVFLNEYGNTPVIRTRLKIWCNGVRIFAIILFKILLFKSHILNEEIGFIP